jgi:hypothetical protein
MENNIQTTLTREQALQYIDLGGEILLSLLVDKHLRPRENGSPYRSGGRMHELVAEGWLFIAALRSLGREPGDYDEWMNVYIEEAIALLVEAEGGRISRTILEIDGQFWKYSPAFSMLDPGGLRQVATEKAIASYLHNSSEVTSIKRAWLIVRAVIKAYWAESSPPPTVFGDEATDVMSEVLTYLADWQSTLADKAEPSEEEVNRASIWLHILVLRALQPEFVCEAPGLLSSTGLVEQEGH